MSIFLNDEERFITARNLTRELKPGSRRWDNVFEYKFNRGVDSIDPFTSAPLEMSHLCAQESEKVSWMNTGHFYFG
jgi:hypothetical protein